MKKLYLIFKINFKKSKVLFDKMVSKAKKESLAPPKGKAKLKALKAKKTMLKGINSHKKKIPMSPTFW